MTKFKFFSLFLFQLMIIIIEPAFSKNSNTYFGLSTDDKKTTENILNKELIKTLFLYGTHMGQVFNIKNSREEEQKEFLNATEGFYNILRGELKYISNLCNISKDCKDFLDEYLIGNNEGFPHFISNYHIKKLLDDSSKHKNDLGSYDQCLYRKYRTENESTVASSSYIIFILDKSEFKNEDGELMYLKTRTNFDDIYFVRAFCLPQIYRNNNPICSDDEYLEFMNTTNEQLGDLLGLRNVTRINTFNLNNITIKKTRKEYFKIFLKFIPIIICLFHIIIIALRRLIIACLINKCYSNKKNEIIKDIKEDLKSINKNENKVEEEEEEEDNDYDEKELIIKKMNLPKWIRIYNKCFCFSENFKELFNFSLNSTNINNDSGLSYIRGLKSSSLFLLILGLNYFTLMNSLSKIFSKTLFYEFLKDWAFYPLFFIGLRYSPRIIFSCSGYTLAYKYLCFINKNFSFLSIIKFILYQFHKYLILISFFIFERFSLYQFLITFNDDSPTWKYFYRNILSKPDGPRFIISFFSLSSLFAVEEGASRHNQTLIDYFWLPYNEVLFFVIGVIIISFGYRFKLRIDIFLLIIILILFISKIVYSYKKINKEDEKYYATLYYYIFDYGKFMLNPLFNLPCYLIGMYFGLINYSVQKGIIDLNTVDIFQKSKIIKNQVEKNLKIISHDLKKLEEEDDDDDENDVDAHARINTLVSEKDKKKDIRPEIKEMPFLIHGVKFSSWLRQHRARLLCFIIFIIIFIFIFFHIFIFRYLFKADYDGLKNKLANIKDDEIDEIKQEMNENERDKLSRDIEELLTLTKYITNNFVNVVYRIDIEIIVFLIQSILFIFYFKGQNFINDFFCHVFWAMLNKSYFSYILVANPMILFIFYQSETKILLNLYNLLLYSLISASLIFLTATFFYLFFELPYKRLIHYIISEDNNDDYNDDLESNCLEEDEKGDDEED